jgi:copper resistance protein D
MRTIVELLLRWIHLIAGIVWFGSVFFSAVIAAPILSRNIPPIQSLRHLSAIRDRLRALLRVAIHVLLITGGMNIFIVGLNTQMNFPPNYVVIFIIKMGFVGLMAAFHILHFSVFGRKLEAAVAELSPDDSELPESVTTLQRRTRLFAFLTILAGLAVFALALSMTGV